MRQVTKLASAVALSLALLAGTAYADAGQRPRDLGIEIGVLHTGQNNAITDVKGVLVGQVTMVDDLTISSATKYRPAFSLAMHSEK